MLSQLVSYAVKPRIYVILRGGLGNQLHQIAAGVKLAEAKKSRIIIFPHIVDTAVNPDRKGLFRKVNFVGLFPNVVIRETSRIENLILRLAIRNSLKLFKNLVVSDENFFKIQKNRISILRGWFQSNEYLPVLVDFGKIIHTEKKDSHDMTIHIRLTDFLTIDPNPLNLAYYSGAIKSFERTNIPDKISCFSDDLQGAQSFLPSNLNYNFPELHKSLDSYELLVELSSSKVLIASKSSLCWWAALCVLSNGGKVVSPFDCPFASERWIKLKPST